MKSYTIFNKTMIADLKWVRGPPWDPINSACKREVCFYIYASAFCKNEFGPFHEVKMRSFKGKIHPETFKNIWWWILFLSGMCMFFNGEN